MFEKLKNFFSVPKPEEIKLQAQPIELNASSEKVLTRKEARLGRLLTIQNPTPEVQAEIEKLQGEI